MENRVNLLADTFANVFSLPFCIRLKKACGFIITYLEPNMLIFFFFPIALKV